MRGKKIDSEFLSEFISNCVTLGFETPELIVNHAESLITNIDEEIKRVEQQKIFRSKLLDVVTTFNKPNTASKSEEAKVLPLFKIQNFTICKEICDKIKDKVMTVQDFSHLKYNITDVLFCIKQLIEHKVLSKSGNHLLKGDLFAEYMKFVLGEV